MSKPPNVGQHWLFHWIDEYEATSQTAIENRLRNPNAFRRLAELVENHRTTDYSNVPLSNTAVAGPWLDPGAAFLCHGISCRSKHLNLNFGRVLHYFDFVMIEGPSADVYRNTVRAALKTGQFDRLALRLFEDIQFLQETRRIGLDKHLVFADKLCSCRPHLLESAEEVGGQKLIDDDNLDQLARQIGREGGVKIRRHGPNEWFGVITHPNFVGSSGHIFRQPVKPERHEVARWLLDRLVHSAIYDAATAKRLGAPLVSLAPAPLLDPVNKPGKLSVDDVGARIRIPSLEGLPLKDLISLRDHEADHFEKYRAVLREAIAETIEKSETDSPERVAEQVWQTKIKPAIADINRKMAANQRSLTAKFVAAATVGAVTGAVGAVTGLPWLVGVGLAAASTPLPQYFKAREERQKIEVEDMYFLWKVAQHH
ncbi:hypothetical protein O3597_25580 [Verrucosispora sp. WMMA2044]|uniref:hypothetical protein n=1 Tax=Verrucosispora sp. WMMA2044 TaxID=3016419 RepID=UPI00248C590C|nr:hypothetical protein [Verrucosispora sp. WMMA2044]WBB48418.1 hypothetical protein O3597_25580 [Verrucosispora sp. WMMA2044]